MTLTPTGYTLNVMLFLRNLIILIPAFLILSSCDHTTLSGKILSESVDFKVGKESELFLDVPDELDGIYRVFWEVEPRELAVIEFYDCVDEQCHSDSGYTGDRKATLIPLYPGEITVTVSGFYRQTNPQGICQRKILITE